MAHPELVPVLIAGLVLWTLLLAYAAIVSLAEGRRRNH